MIRKRVHDARASAARRVGTGQNDQDIRWLQFVFLNVFLYLLCEHAILLICATEYAALNGVVGIQQLRKIAWIRRGASPDSYVSPQLKGAAYNLVTNARPDGWLFKHLNHALPAI